MKGSKYSTGNDGMCDAKACKNVLLISDARSVDPGLVQAITQSAAKIGITFTARTINGAYPTHADGREEHPISDRPGWGKDFANAVTFFEPLFDGRNIIPVGNIDYSLPGSPPRSARSQGERRLHLQPETGLGVPSINNLSTSAPSCSGMQAPPAGRTPTST